MKPILFNTEMVSAILDGRKTVMRRVVKPQPNERIIHEENELELIDAACSPYRPGDILYVREAWNYGYIDITDFKFRYNEPFFEELAPGSQQGTYLMPRYFYRTEDLDDIDGMSWHPPIYMPKEAARLFLRVTDVQVERLQNITEEQAEAEGCSKWYEGTKVEIPACSEFCDVWDSTIKKADLPIYGWDANPWVWVVKFQQIRKEEAKNEG